MEKTRLRQTTNNILMIRPVQFGFNPQTAETNTFQKIDDAYQPAKLQEEALNEFNNFANKLKAAGINVFVFDDSLKPHTPDSIFPNNWVSFHEDGRVVLYPMQAQNRRLERKTDLIYRLKDNYGFDISQIVDLSYFEREEKFLEGTGSMVLDHESRIAYACISPRTHIDVLKIFCEKMGYEPVTFHAENEDGVAVYHTNVLMGIGEKLAIICADSIKNKTERENVINKLSENREVVLLSFEQVKKFAGNMLFLQTVDNEQLLVVSEQGFNSLTQEQINHIRPYAKMLNSNLNCIETYGGGSARCMMAEIFCPKQ